MRGQRILNRMKAGLATRLKYVVVNLPENFSVEWDEGILFVGPLKARVWSFNQNKN